MPVVGTKGAMSSQGFGEFAQASTVANYIEDVFSTYLYTGTSAAQTINNGINLSGKGGMLWIKSRSNAYNHWVVDSARGTGNDKPRIQTNTTAAQSLLDSTAFLSNGFTVYGDSDYNGSGSTYASWSFRKQPKFFDVVTYTGTGAASKTINHNLGSVPGCIIVKRLDSTGDWLVYHRGLYSDPAQAYNFFLKLNTTSASSSTSQPWSSAPTSTSFSISSGQNANVNGATYVAYLFAHNAGGFGLTGADNVISCGSYTGNGAAGGQLINLGYETQWVMIKQANASGSGWWMMDPMRGWYVNGDFGGEPALFAESFGAESNQVMGQPEAQGFRPIQDNVNQSGQTYIYIAIRRGPMKVPTSASNYFAPVTRVGNGGNPTISGGITDDAAMIFRRPGSTSTVMVSRLTANPYLETVNTNAQNTDTLAFPTNTWDVQQGLKLGGNRPIVNSSGVDYVDYHLRRAPGFFDEVCWSADGTGGAITLNHNLTVTPELLFYKRRSGGTGNWFVYAAPLGLNGSLNLNNSDANPGYGRVSAVSATTFTTDPTGNTSGATYIARLFATCPKVSKVGSYVGSSSDVTVDCGFTSGARFVLIRRILFGTTPDTGNWWVFDSARGMTTSSDPAFLLNSTAAEFSGNYVDQTATGFVAKAGNSETNAANQTYIYLAIA